MRAHRVLHTPKGKSEQKGNQNNALSTERVLSHVPGYFGHFLGRRPGRPPGGDPSIATITGAVAAVRATVRRRAPATLAELLHALPQPQLRPVRRIARTPLRLRALTLLLAACPTTRPLPLPYTRIRYEPPSTHRARLLDHARA